MASVHEAFQANSGNWALAPGGTVVHSAAAGFKELRFGDHIVVLRPGFGGGIAHHGIVIGDVNNPAGLQVAEYASPTHDKKLKDGRLQLTPFDQFLAGYTTFGIVPYAPTDHTNEDAHRISVVNRAQALVNAPPSEVNSYKLLTWEREAFAWVCKTGDFNAKHTKVRQVLNTIKMDLRRNGQAFKLQNHPKGAKKCVIC